MDDIEARREPSARRQQRALQEIQQQFAPYQRGFNADLAALEQGAGSRAAKVIKLGLLLSEVRDRSAAQYACRQGCAYCCHQMVTLSQLEADAIGQQIGRVARVLPATYRLPTAADFGAHTPCTFLVDGACSIYPYRPMMCRNQVNLDVDNLLCRFENWPAARSEQVPVPMLQLGPVLGVYQRLSGKKHVAGDIRDFFPAPGSTVP